MPYNTSVGHWSQHRSWPCNLSVYQGCCQILHCSGLVQQALRVKWRVFGVFVCFDLYFVNYRSWQAEILQEHAEGCIQVDLQKKIRQDKNNFVVL